MVYYITYCYFLFDIFQCSYIITGNNLGETKIVFSTGSGEMMVSSEPVNVQVILHWSRKANYVLILLFYLQVFPPLRLYPRNTTLVVGSSVQIYYHGGPHPDVNIVYQVHDQKVICMSHIGQGKNI